MPTKKEAGSQGLQDVEVKDNGHLIFSLTSGDGKKRRFEVEGDLKAKAGKPKSQ